MIATSRPFDHLLLTTLMVASFVVSPVAGPGQSAVDREHLTCLKTMQACKSFCSHETKKRHADYKSSNLSQRKPLSDPESNPYPCGDPGDCSCCILVSSCTMILGMMRQPDQSNIDKIIHIVPFAVHATVYPGWRDPLLRPPIC